MCFTTTDLSDDPPPRPVQIPHQHQPSASMPQPFRASMPKIVTPPGARPPSHQMQNLAHSTDYAPPSGPPPSHDYAPPAGPPPRRSAEQYAPPPGAPPSHGYAPPAGPPPRRSAEEYAPPAGPPPRRSAEDFAPPPGPPPSHDYTPPMGPPPSKHNPFYEDVQPPSGPPPSHGYGGQGSSEFAPPPGPPPSHDYAPPPGPPPSQGYKAGGHDWESAVPDTALLPPPPNFFSGFDRSPADNATEEESEAGERWCRDFPLSNPLRVSPGDLNAINSGNINMFAPPFYRGTLNREAVGVWRGQTPSSTTDTHLATYPPLYSVSAHSPLTTGRRKVIYYEVHILQDSREEISLALGFTAPPYPPFRLPGWHRASLGVHGDDGHKYINARWGGKSFTHPFRRGETLGLGMVFTPGYGGGIGVDVFFTRDGVESGRWNIHEETDKDQDLPVTGLEGFHDLCAAIGVYDKVSFEIVFVPERWRWQGWKALRD